MLKSNLYLISKKMMAKAFMIKEYFIKENYIFHLKYRSFNTISQSFLVMEIDWEFFELLQIDFILGID